MRSVMANVSRGIGAVGRVLPVTLALALTAAPAKAADWTLGGTFIQRFEADTNLELDDDSDGPAYGGITSVDMAVSGRTGNASWSLVPGFRASGFVGPGAENDLNEITPRLSGEALYSGLNFEASGNFSFTRSSTAFTQFADGALDDGGIFIPDDSLLTERETTQTTVRGQVGLLYKMDARNDVRLTGNVLVRRFAEDVASLEPTTTYGARLAWTHRTDPRGSVGLDVGIRRFTADDDENTESLTLDVTGRVNRRLTQRVSVNAGLGVSATRQTEDVTDLFGTRRDTENNIGFNGNFGFDLQGADTRLRLNAGNSVQPSSSGELRNFTTLGLGVSHAVNHRTQISLDARHTLTTTLGTSGGGDDDLEQFFALSPVISYSLTDDWQAQLGYSFRLSSDEDGTAISNKVFVSLSHSFAVIP